MNVYSLGVTYGEALRANAENRSKIGDLAPMRSVLPKISDRRGWTTNHFCTDSWANECFTTLSLTIFTQRNFVADFLQAKCDFTPKTAFFASLSPLSGAYGQRTMIISDSLLVLIELFSLCITAEALRANIGSKLAILLQRGPVLFDPKFQIKGVAPSPAILVLRKLG